ncbi:MAG TPA: 16S rRNA (uracil(1498)-N(3))-methyltransferase [Blastocatellia bacterium]|nr:16S rRNA (uracil(1498)-N(3))-methyltransferase [Blastocatellia bacterium]
MQRRRFYAPPDLINGSRVNLSRDETHHLTRVLRLRPGDEAFVFDGCGREYRCAFLAVKDDSARLEIKAELSGEVESPINLTLAQALAKGERFELAIQKATELGVNSIIPLLTEHADVKLSDERSEKRLERWRRISLEALKQSGRRRLTEIKPPVTFKDFLESQGGGSSVLLVFSERGGDSITKALAGSVDKKRVAAMVGPEGGWGDDELKLAADCGARAVTLGPRILRTETAAIVAIALIQHALGDLSAP